MLQRRHVDISWHGHTSYSDGILRQEERVAAIQEGEGREALLFFEHDPVVTIGRSGNRDHIRTGLQSPARSGLEVIECDRGGDVTYHGPGQLVAYPILDLSPDRRDMGKYLRDLEEVLLRTIADHGIAGQRIPGLTGVWVDVEKIAAIGVRVARWITSHGIALNVTPNLDHFDTIVPCGLADHRVTSIEALTGTAPELREVAIGFARHFMDVFDRVPGGPMAIQEEARQTCPRP